ncbi:hypothetical protein [Caballeronia sp. LZ035]|uniref:hypothetical protein n=1 Tax=Caballeronia sp. LZ035 TaxID=3038568 RepID=UPI00285D86F9|nr:hypothetical protein [Caballeronia sp. LZ035]MDR5763008.1 hypothetical protein [Caballeronia sp. LZ035]
MFSTKFPPQFALQAAVIGALVLAASGAMAQESHLTLDDIDKLARQKIVDSMRKSDGANNGVQGGVGLGSPLSAPAPASAPAAPKFVEHKPLLPKKRVVPATFVGAYSDMSGAYVLYDFQGATYTARQGSRLLNGWTVASVKDFTVTLVDGKRKWTETISAPTDLPLAAPDSPAIRAISDLGSPLPPGGLPTATASTFVPFGK